jgi:hypothetical protein
MTVFIYVKDNPQNFAILLVQLQPQLKEEDDIYIVDATPNREGLRLAKLYGSTRCYIFVEVGDYDWKTAYNFAEQNMFNNKQEGILHLRENLIISSTFISNMKKAAQSEYGIIYPVLIGVPYERFPSDFKWYNSAKTVKDAKVKGITITCFYKKAKGNNYLFL